MAGSDFERLLTGKVSGRSRNDTAGPIHTLPPVGELIRVPQMCHAQTGCAITVPWCDWVRAWQAPQVIDFQTRNNAWFFPLNQGVGGSNPYRARQ